MNRTLSRLTTVLSGLFLLLVLLYTLPQYIALIFRLIPQQSFGFVGLYESLLPLLLFPAPFLLIIALITRRWLALALTLPLIGAAVFWYVGLFIPRTTSPTMNERVLTVLTYNARTDLNTPDTLEAVLRDANADLVALQEINLPELTERLADTYPHTFAISDQMILSRHPLDTTDTAATWEQASHADAVRVIVTVGDTPIIFYNIHPKPPNVFGLLRGDLYYEEQARTAGYEQLIPRLAEENGPVIIAGDFNTTDRGAPYRQLRATYRDTFAEVGWGFGFTFPQVRQTQQRLALQNRTGIDLSFLPASLRIDYVMHNANGIRSLQAETLYIGDSDHYPVKAWLGIQ